MTLLTGLHGTAALVLLCSLIFVEEAGVPLPVLPGDGILMVGGLFIARGSLSPWIFIPMACLAALGGALTARAWAKAVGSRGLTAMARRLHAERALERATTRVHTAGPTGVAVCRLLPGLRVYSSMVAGATELDLRTFLLGAVPAILLWVGVFTALGILVGAPAMQALGRAQRLAAEGFVLTAVGVVAYLGIRHIPATQQENDALCGVVPPLRVFLAICLDVGIIATVVSGLTELSDLVVGFPDIDGVIDVSLVAAAILLTYVAAFRHRVGGTAGETLMAISYPPSAMQA
jgi:membrane-associated protein